MKSFDTKGINRGDFVLFKNKNRLRAGKVVTVDCDGGGWCWGEQASFDILVEDENCIYKHTPADDVYSKQETSMPIQWQVKLISADKLEYENDPSQCSVELTRASSAYEAARHWQQCRPEWHILEVIPTPWPKCEEVEIIKELQVKP